jgi:sortase A
MVITRALERLLLVSGTVLLGFWALAFFHQRALAALDLASFRASPPVSQDPAPGRDAAGPAVAAVANAGPFSADRLAILEAPAIDLEVVVLAGTSAATLNRGVGSIAGTPPPGGAGNAGLAGHRDGTFRGLGRLEIGDEIRITRAGGERVLYRIAWTRVVRPDEVWVLDPTEESALTLVTCHPFDYLGRAPNRYVVRAEAASEIAARE